MDKYINATKLLEEIHHSVFPSSMTYTLAVGMVEEWLNEAPEAIVRCKDCKHYISELEMCKNDGYHPSKYWFCTDGRKNDRESEIRKE